jgi:hypothetical protein
MPFPISIAGTVTIQKGECNFVNAEQAGTQIRVMLHDAGAYVVNDGVSIRFKSPPPFLGGSWNILVPLDDGVISIRDDGSTLDIEYRASTVRLLVVVTCLIFGAAALFLHADLNSNEPANLTPFEVLPFGWLWLFGVNYIIVNVRFPGWLGNVVRQCL